MTTPQELISQMRAIMEELTKITGNKSSDKNEPIFYGSGITDVRVIDGCIQLGIQTELGWVVAILDVANATQLSANITSLSSRVLRASNTEPAIKPFDRNTLH
jgi:hypothetical protein